MGRFDAAICVYATPTADRHDPDKHIESRSTLKALNERLASHAPPRLLRQAGVYTASNLILRAIPFILLPVLTRYLSPTDYGIVTMFLLTVVIVEPFMSLGIVSATTVKFYDKTVDLPAYLGTGGWLVAGLSLPIALLLLLLQEPLTEATRVPAPWLLLVVPLILARVCGATLLAHLRVREKALQYGIFQNAQSAALIALTLLLVVVFGEQWRGRVIAEIVATSVAAIAALMWLWRGGWVRLVFVQRYARDLARFGIPLIPHALGAVLIVQTDRLLLTNLVGVGETGVYMVGYQLALVIELVAASFNNAYTPWLFRKLVDANEDVKRKLVRYTYLQFAAMAALAAAIAIVMPVIGGLVLDPAYTGSVRFVGWFALGFLFQGMYFMVTSYIFYAQKTRWLAAVTITVALANIPLTYVLIRVNGAIGAAQAHAITLGLSFLLTWIVSQRVYPMPWLGRRPSVP